MGRSAERRRSPRVALNIVVTVGVEASVGGWHFVEAYTLSVSAHGGLVEMGVKVEAQQKLLLINARTGSRQESRVVNVSRSPSHQYAVAFEFLDPAAAFWPIQSFLPDAVPD
jgi:hypothetical protein